MRQKGFRSTLLAFLTVSQPAILNSEDRPHLQASGGAIRHFVPSTLMRTGHPNRIVTPTNESDMHDHLRETPRLESSTVPVDPSMDDLNWFPDFDDISSSWMPIDDNNYGNDAGSVIDPGALGDLFHSSFNMCRVMDNFDIPPDNFTS